MSSLSLSAPDPASASASATAETNAIDLFKEAFKEDGWKFDNNENESYIGQAVRTIEDGVVLEGTVLCHLPALDRRPKLWRLGFGSVLKDVTREELQECLDLATKRWGSFNQMLDMKRDALSKFHHVAHQRSEEALAHYCETNVLPQLCILAALEESLHQLILSSSQGGGDGAGIGRRSNTTALQQSPPRYYSSPPSHYLQQPSVAGIDSESKNSGGFAPSILAQRIRQGAHMAYQYHHQTLEALDESKRRSKRITTPIPQKPQPVQRGGRIAMYLLELLEGREQEGDDNAGKEEEGSREEDSRENDAQEEEASEDEEEPEESGEESEDEEEDDDDNVVHDNPYLVPSFDSVLDWLGRRGKSMSGVDVQNAICACLVKSGKDNNSKVGLSPSQLHDVDHLVLQEQLSEKKNNKTVRIVLECTTGDKLKDLPLLEVTSFSRCKFALEVFDSTQKSSKPSKQEQLLELQQAEQAYKTKKSYDTWRFKSIHGGYSKWPQWMDAVQQQWKVHLEEGSREEEVAGATSMDGISPIIANGQEKTATTENNGDALATASNTVATESATGAGATTTNAAATATGASTGATESPAGAASMTTTTIAESSDDTPAPVATSSAAAATESVEESVAETAPAGPVTSTEIATNDLALATSLQQNEENATSLRRTTRRRGAAGADGAPVVFYGGQSNMTQKQLQDTVCRLLDNKKQGPQSLMHLLRLVAEESTNPLKRLRVAMGKLLCKAHLVTRWNVTTVNSDKDLVGSRPLWVAMNMTTAAAAPVAIKSEEPAPAPAAASINRKDMEPANIIEEQPDATAMGEEKQPSAAVVEEKTEVATDAIPEKEAEVKVNPAADPKDEEEVSNVENPMKKQHELNALVSYLHTLHQTELSLRRMVLSHLTNIPLPVVATAADERPGSLEAMDANDFLEEDGIDWTRAGHEYLQKRIYRPPLKSQLSSCRWYEIEEYCPSISLASEESAAPESVDATSSTTKRPLEVERRMRFRAFPVVDDEKEGDGDENSNLSLILTQAQVHAGLEAAALQRDQRQTENKNPFSSNMGANISLQRIEDESNGGTPMDCKVVGHDTVLVAPEISERGLDKVLEHRILILPDKDASQTEQPSNGNQPQEDAESSTDATSCCAFWASLSEASDGTLTCRPMSDPETCYKISQSDYHPSSRAFQECQTIVEYLKNHHRSDPFMEPVDPVALNVPDYFDVIKNPMDISTLESNLEKGVYSKIPPSDNSVGQTPVARMLNGIFKDDIEKIFDNAMLFNPPDDWIHAAAASMKKAVLRKIDTASQASYQSGSSTTRWREKKSVYVDEDSDVDMYIYESDRDDEDFDTSRRSRKRKHPGRTSKKEDHSTRVIEHPVRLQKTLSESVGIGGPFADMPIQSNASSFTLPPEWSCHRKASPTDEEGSKDGVDHKRRSQEMLELLALHREVEENERASLRRSTRSHVTGEQDASADASMAAAHIEYLLSEVDVPPIHEEAFSRKADSRSNVEIVREAMHESYYARLFQELSSFMTTAQSQRTDSKMNVGASDFAEGEMYGLYVNDSFPPFLGRIVPSSNQGSSVWEIRPPYVVAALRWVIRGLVRSGHLSEVEPLLANDSPLATGVILVNNVYHCDESLEPFDVLDVKEMQRRKRANNAGESSDESDDFEMSEYEKLRAERVARNRERLKSLGLA